MLTDRSRIECFEICPRKRYLQYHLGGVGIDSGKKDVELWTGSQVHDGIDILGELPLEDVVVITKVIGMKAVKTNGLLADDQSNIASITEQLDLQEVLIRLHEIWWQQFGKDYTVVAIEQEINWPLTDEITFMSRPDKIVRRNSDGAAFVLNYKTVGNADDTWRKQWRYDSQMISESLAAKAWLEQKVDCEHTLVEGSTDTYNFDMDHRWKKLGWQSTPPHYGVIVVGLLKGKMSWGEGPKVLENPLVNCWMLPGDGLNPPTFKHKYKWTCTEPHAKCPGGKNHTLGSTYKRVRVSEDYPGGIKAWMELLPVDFLLQFVLQLEAIMPSEFEVQRWLTSVKAQEESVVYSLTKAYDATQNTHLDSQFPMHTHSGNCFRPRQCSYFDACHGVGLQFDDPDKPPIGWQWRTPNHLLEKQKGVITT